MRYPSVRKLGSGAFVLRDLPPLITQALQRLPEILADDAPGIARRASPDAYVDDAERNEEWRRFAAPELRHLFVSAREIVTRDLEGLKRGRGLARRGWRLEIPPEHLTAWLSSLAAARVALGEAHELDAAMLEKELPPVLTSQAERATLLIHLLGWVQGLLVEAGA